MMTTNQLLNYHSLTLVYESANSLIYRGLRDEDNLPVVLKLMKSEYPSPAELTRYQHEHEILLSLNLAGVVKTYGLQQFENRLMLVMEDIGGESLAQLSATRPLSLVEFLQLAIALAQSLGELHAQNIIHKDINPTNIVVNSTTDPWQVKWIDFNIASVLPRENPTLSNPNVLEGTLSYLSPEQTGRMNRALDYRTDFYSLGITFYQLLTGELPFKAREALELVHAHLALSPQPPHQVQPAIPQPLSNLVLKLLAKMAEERYQSAWGLKADLEECLKQFQTAGDIVEFPLGRYDVSPRFQLSQKLYGRELELQTLLAAFEKITTGTSPSTTDTARHARTELLLVSGYAGLGKSALVQELYKPLTQQRGYFIAGKCDQFQQNLPYFSLGLAFTDLVRQLLTESEVVLSGWREQLLMALGNQGQVIIDVIPEVERLLGSQPAVPQLGATEAQNRFHWVFLQMLKVVCQPDHPLVLFLDDLQWADSATLKLLEVLLTEEELSHLLIIGAYRDNEVSATHPLLMTLTKLKQEPGRLHDIVLTPLTLDSLTDWLAESLHRSPGAVAPLAELVMRKTQGNPFFVNEFMKMLYQEQLLTFRQPTSADSLSPLGESESGWQWTLADLEALVVTDNVVDLMLGKLRKLPVTTQTVLGLAACLGNRFDLPILADLYGQPAVDTFQTLQIALQEELIRPRSALETSAVSSWVLDAPWLIQHYQFQHDRIHEAAYALLDSPRRQAVHLQIGRQLQVTVAANANVNASSHQQFELVDHLNEARSLLTTESERLELAHLNLVVGQQAKQTSAYLSAVHYLQIGRDLFTSTTDDWTSHPDLAFPLPRELAEALYLNGQFETAEAVIQQTLALPLPLLNQIALYQLLIVLYTQLARYPEAIQTGRQALHLLGIDLPDTNLEQALETEMAAAQAQLGNKAIASLIDLPELTNVEPTAALQVLSTLDATAYIANPTLWMVIIAKMVNLSLTHGHAAESACGYSNYGVLKGLLQGDYNSAYQFSRLALTLSDKFHDLYQKCKASFDFSFGVNPWTKHLKEADAINEEGYQAGLAAGKLQNAGYNVFYKTIGHFYQGNFIKSLLDDIPAYLRFSQKTLNHWASDGILAFQLTLWNLSGLTASPTAFNTDQLTEENYLTSSEAHQSGFALCTYQILKAQVGYLYGNSSDALVNLEQAAKRLEFVSSTFPLAEYNFYHSLTLAALYPNVSETLQTEYGEKLVANQKQMKLWADNGPANFLHKYLLVTAEQARLAGRNEEALECYESAIAEATAQGFVQNAALANELTAKFWRGRGKPDLALIYLKKAWYGYQQWGATRKITLLEQTYPQLKVTTKKASPVSTIYATTLTQATITTDSNSGTELDFTTILKASQTLASEIQLSHLLEHLMKIVMENAGAQRGLLLLHQHGDWVIEAERVLQPTETMTVLQSLPLAGQLPHTLVNYVTRHQQAIVLDNATNDDFYKGDPYVRTHQVKSVLCHPIIYKQQLTGLIYLENNLSDQVFTPARLEVLKLLSVQIAISLENARFVTELEQARQAETEARQAAEAANYAKTAFMANVTHELRTPLNGILGYTQLLNNDPVLPTAQKESVKIIHRSGEYLLMLVSDILEVSRMQSAQIELQPVAFHLGKFLTDLANQFASRCQPKRLSFLYEPSPQLPIGIQADEKRLRQILIYLLSNAVKFTQQGGIKFSVQSEPDQTEFLKTEFLPLETRFLTPKTEFLKPETRFSETRFSETRLLRFQIEDTGIGIAAADLERIFLPFEQVSDWKQKSEGAGLGLSLAKQLVEKMGGQLQVTSELGQGSRFWFLLEVPEASSADVAMMFTPAPIIIGYQKGETAKPIKILVVDDNWELRAVLVHLLKPLGFDLIEASHGIEGLDQARDEVPDLIITDLVMPVMDGFDFIRTLRKRPGFHSLPIIAMSESLPADGGIPGCQAAIAKPIQAGSLLELLQQHLGLTWSYGQPPAKATEANVVPDEDFTESGPLKGPSAAQATELLGLANIGDFGGILELVEQLEQEDTELQPFAKKIRQLAENYDDEGISELTRNLAS